MEITQMKYGPDITDERDGARTVLPE